MADSPSSTKTKNYCDHCISTMEQVRDMFDYIDKVETKIDNMPTYIQQIMTNQQDIHQKWLKMKTEQSQQGTHDKPLTKMQQELEDLAEKIDMIPSYMKELEKIQTSLQDGWIAAKAKLDEAIIDARKKWME